MGAERTWLCDSDIKYIDPVVHQFFWSIYRQLSVPSGEPRDCLNSEGV